MDHKEQLVKAGAKMKADKLTVETWGNLSICDRERGLVTITPSGMDYDAIAPEDMVVVDLAGNHVEGFRKPSIEVPMHTAPRPAANIYALIVFIVENRIND